MDLGSGNPHCGYRRPRMRPKLWLFLPVILILTGCSLQKMKSGLLTGAATTGLVAASNAVMPAAIVLPAVVGGVTAATVSAVTAERSGSGEPVSVIADTVVQQAPDNFFTLLGKLIKIGGLATVLIVLVPMIFSWLMPGPIQFKGKKKK